MSKEMTAKQIAKGLESRLEDIKNGSEQGLRDAAHFVLGEARQRAPIDTGDLRRSGYVKVGSDNAIIGFTAEYAAAVHEDMTAKHKGGTSAKFLELAVHQNRKTILRLIAEETK